MKKGIILLFSVILILVLAYFSLAALVPYHSADALMTGTLTGYLNIAPLTPTCNASLGVLTGCNVAAQIGVDQGGTLYGLYSPNPIKTADKLYGNELCLGNPYVCRNTWIQPLGTTFVKGASSCSGMGWVTSPLATCPVGYARTGCTGFIDAYCPSAYPCSYIGAYPVNTDSCLFEAQITYPGVCMNAFAICTQMT